MFHPVLGRKTNCRRTTLSWAANSTHATATAMHFPANAGLTFLTDKLTNDRYLVDTVATSSIVPCSQNSSPSGLLKGADGQPILSWSFIQKLCNSKANFLHPVLCKPLWPVPFCALTFLENSKSLSFQKSTIFSLLALQRPRPPLICFQRPRPPLLGFQRPSPPLLCCLLQHWYQLRFQSSCLL